MKISRVAIATLAAAITFLHVPGIARASDTSGVSAAVNHAVTAFNQGDMKAWAASCASPASIVDEFAPHSWQGPAACSDWASAYAVYCKHVGITDGMVTLGPAWHLTVTGNHAYAVYPATYAFKQHGKPMKESGIFALAFQKSAAGWLISGWAWAAH